MDHCTGAVRALRSDPATVTFVVFPDRSEGGFLYRRDLSASADGRVAEWFKAPVLKTGGARKGSREFESHPFRHNVTT